MFQSPPVWIVMFFDMTRFSGVETASRYKPLHLGLVIPPALAVWRLSFFFDEDEQDSQGITELLMRRVLVIGSEEVETPQAEARGI